MSQGSLSNPRDWRRHRNRRDSGCPLLRARQRFERTNEAARREHPDLIVYDIMMPRVDGLALLAALRADTVTPTRNWLDMYVQPEDRVRRLGDSYGWISSRAVPIKDAHGRIVEWARPSNGATVQR